MCGQPRKDERKVGLVLPGRVDRNPLISLKWPDEPTKAFGINITHDMKVLEEKNFMELFNGHEVVIPLVRKLRLQNLC